MVRMLEVNAYVLEIMFIKIVSKIEDPMVEFEEQIPIRTYYVFPYIEKPRTF